MNLEPWELVNRHKRQAQRARLRRDFGHLGYKKCSICESPVRPKIRMDPATNGILTVGGIEVTLRLLCEICWREHRGIFGDQAGVVCQPALHI